MTEDQKKKLEKVLKKIPGYNPWDQPGECWLDHDAAAAAINFFADRLKHVEGSARGKPFELRAWQAAIVGNLFGWKRKDDADRIVRRYRKALIYIPRGNGKTPLAAGIVLKAFFEDGEPGSQCFLAAGDRAQAGILFRNAKGFIEQDERFASSVKFFGGEQQSGATTKSIVLIDDPMSFCKVIPADGSGQHGGIPHITVIDEVHVQESRDLLDAFESGMTKKVRSQPLLVLITTADCDRVSICNEVYDYACKVRDNGGDPAKPGFDPYFLPVIYEASAKDDWTSEATWAKANPNLGFSVDREALKAECRYAQDTPGYENSFKRYKLNIRTEQDMRIISMRAWDACPSDVRLQSLAGRDCYAGLDLSSTEDLSSLALLFPLEQRRIAVLSFSWCPEDRVQRRVRQRVPYDVWIRQEHLTATSGNVIDYGAIRAKIKELAGIYNIREIGYDPHGATQIAQDLQDGDGFEVHRITQSFMNLSAPTKELLGLVKSRRLVHLGNPVLRWAASNAAAHFDGKLPIGASQVEDFIDKVPIMLSKRKSADKIDPIAAVVLALARMGEHGADAGDAGPALMFA